MDEPNEVLSEKTGVADCTEASREASADHDRQAEGRTRRFPFRKARGAAFALAVCAVAAGLTFRIGIGTSSRHRPGFRPGLRSYAPRKRIANLARDIEVDQEMLSQRLFCPYFTHFRLSVIRNNSRPRTPRS